MPASYFDYEFEPGELVRFKHNTEYFLVSSIEARVVKPSQYGSTECQVMYRLRGYGTDVMAFPHEIVAYKKEEIKDEQTTDTNEAVN